MNWMMKLERKWGRYAIYDLHKYFVFVYFIGAVLGYLGDGEIMNYLNFSVPAILQGQVWRLVTWVLCGSSGGLLGFVFMLCLIPMGKNLEHCLGAFRMNVYLFGGVLLNIIGGILVYVITYFATGVGFPVYLSLYYILLSTFMALAICVPDATVNLYFVLPIKMKWMLAVYLLELGYEIYTYYKMGGIFLLCALGAQIIFALLNLFLFFYFAQVRLDRSQKKRQRQFRAQMEKPWSSQFEAKYKCAVCGRTEKDDSSLEFRYCSKCTGNKAYCQEHLFTHTHR